MMTLRRIPWWAVLLCLLVLVDIGWRCWMWTHPRMICSSITSISGQPFTLMANHKANVDAVSIRKEDDWKPIWAEWDFNGDHKVDEMSFYHADRTVMNINTAGGRPKYVVFFYGPGKSMTWWEDREGAGTFTDRWFYDETGKLVRHEVLSGQTWQPAAIEGRGK